VMEKTRFISESGEDPVMMRINPRIAIAMLDLAWDVSVTLSHAAAGWSHQVDPAVLEAFPAMELLEDIEGERDYSSVWQRAGGRLVQGRMIAHKLSPVWAALDEFGMPCAAWVLGGPTSLQDVDAREAERFGIKIEEKS